MLWESNCHTAEPDLHLLKDERLQSLSNMVETTTITVTREQIVEDLLHCYCMDPLLHTKKDHSNIHA